MQKYHSTDQRIESSDPLLRFAMISTVVVFLSFVFLINYKKKIRPLALATGCLSIGHFHGFVINYGANTTYLFLFDCSFIHRLDFLQFGLFFIQLCLSFLQICHCYVVLCLLDCQICLINNRENTSSHWLFSTMTTLCNRVPFKE